ncbi:MAG: DMT family transporter [Hyphomicrobiales bacterium]|nr:DMT family transporter [Hyphomicrobiales bacterium]
MWALFTLCAATAQTARNAMQRDLIRTIGTGGATYVRFIFALPFTALMVLAGMWFYGVSFPQFGMVSLGWTFAGAAAQMIATALMLAGMRQRSFSVVIAFIKTEPVFIAIGGIILLGDIPTIAVAAAIVIATAGVLLISWPKAAQSNDSQANAADARDWKPAMLGLSGGVFFALSATSYRGALITLDTPSIFMAAASMQLIGQLMQSVPVLIYMALFDRPVLTGMFRAWKPSLFAGSMGALASLFWFMAFALTSAAKVRTLALVEVPMAMVVSRQVFKQGASARDYAGMVLIVAGIVLLFNG